MIREFTATACIIKNNQVLLHFHKKMNKWLPPGGHVEKDETPTECAIREAKEETGLDISIISDEHLEINEWNATSFARPFLCLLENIPAYRDQPIHQHVDFIYIAKPIGETLCQEAITATQLGWFTLQEVLALTTDEMFSETQQIIKTIFNLVHKKSLFQHDKE
jgi:8-oxo-dGTP pyrophosphatase MutT (NUDIX family)